MQTKNKRTVLSDRFLIGEELGRGAYGQVFKGMDTTTGDVVAIKQIGLSGVSQENLQGVMGEIDLLKTLNHKHIVKYIGSFKTRSHLYIILEFMENGALSSVIKPNRFGVFPETLVAIYIAQVLQGLAYLHDQGVVHRDIKGANILTTKDGLVKLADFGVAAKLGELDEQHCDELHQNVVGTPYWMAPEVIEMTQVTPASDIWSVGCLIIELLTGYPPYYDLQPMSALFRIVQDPHPPLPETVSPLLEDFLLKCFQKDPSARPDARMLLQHEWVQFNRKTLRGTWNRTQGFKTRGAGGAKASDAHETVNSVVARILAAEASEDEVPSRSSTDTAAAAAVTKGPATVRTVDAAAGPLVSNTPANLALQQDALTSNSSSTSNGPAVGSLLQLAPTLLLPIPSGGVAGPAGIVSVSQQQQQLQQQRRQGSIELAAAANGYSSPVSSPRGRLLQPGLAAAKQQAQQRQPPQQQGHYRQQQPPQPQLDDRQWQQQQQQQLTAQQQQQQRLVQEGEQQQQQQGQQWQQLKQQSQAQPPPPGQQPMLQQPPAGQSPTRPALLTFIGQQLQYGPAAAQAGTDGRQTPVSGHLPASAGIDSPLSSLLARMQGDQAATSSPGVAAAAGGAAAAAAGSSHNLMLWLDEGPAASAGSMTARGQLYDSASGLFSGAAGAGNTLMPVPSSGSLVSQNSSVHSSQVGLDIAESSFLLESKRKVRDLVKSLRQGAGRDSNISPPQAAAGLAAMFGRLPDARQHFLAEGGVLAALELLESDQARMAEAALDLLIAFTAADARLLESLCLVGLVPIVARMAAGSAAAGYWLGPGGNGAGIGGGAIGAAAAKEAGLGSSGVLAAAAAAAGGVAGPIGTNAELIRLRCKASGFVAQLCFARETTLQMFIACGGLRCLVAMVQDNLPDPATLTLTAVACIWQVLETYGALPINYICRIFTNAGLVQRLYAVIKQLVSLGRQQHMQPLQQQQQRGYAGAFAAGVPKLHHLHSASSPNIAGQAFVPLGGLDGVSTLGPDGDIGPGGLYTGQGIRPSAPAHKGGTGREAGLAGMDELQHHRRTHSVDDSQAAAAAAAASGNAGGHQQTRAEWLLAKCLDLLLVLAHADSVVKGLMCSKDNLQQLLDLTQRMGPPGLLKVVKTIRWLTSEPSVLPAVKDSGAISQLVPFLSREREAATGQAVVLEALQALYNICKFNKRVHLEVAATGGIVPHLCRFASEAVTLHHAPQLAAAATSLAPAAGDPLAAPAALSAPGVSDAWRAAMRSYVVPLLIGMATTSSSTRAKLWASNGLDIFLQLLSTEDPQMQVGLMRTLDIWLAEDHSRVENRLCQREAISQLIEVYSRLCKSPVSARSPVMPQMLDSLKLMLGRSSKVAVALATGGLVPPLLEPLTAGLTGQQQQGTSGGNAPILRAKLLEIVRIMYQHYPRPKEFIMKYRIQDVLLRLLETEGRGEDAVKLEAQKLLNAFHINVLL